MDKSKRKNTEGKVYKPQGVRLWGSIIVMGIIAIQIVVMVFLFSGDDMPNNSVWFINFAIAMLALALFILFIQVAESSLTVYEDGLEWQRGKSVLFSTWDNMRAIERKNEGDAATYGIQLHEKVEVEINGWFDKFFYGSSTDYIRLTGIVNVPMRFAGLKGNVIKLDEFAETEFGQDLMHYAPHLFEPLP